MIIKTVIGQDFVFCIDQYFEKNKELYINDKHKFFDQLLEHYFSNHELAYGQYFFKDWLYTPFKKDSEDYGDLDGFYLFVSFLWISGSLFCVYIRS